MASPPPQSLSDTLSYFAHFSYPLTPDELWFWQHKTTFSKLLIGKLFRISNIGFRNFSIRKKRELISKQKWIIAKRVGESLKKIPFIQAIFVTGSLAMDNCQEDADIDLMVITSPHTLWLTRLLLYLYLNSLSLRRQPQVATAPDKICDNLYLDIRNLELKIKNLYTAHEILQAKCIFDRSHVHRQFLTSNSWVKPYLPIAYSESLKKLGIRNSLSQLEIRSIRLIYYLLFPINLLLFLLQYLYMKPKMTSEKVGLGFAFFHPSSPS